MTKMKQQYFSPESEVVKLALENGILDASYQAPYEGNGVDWFEDED